MDLLTITSHHGITKERETRLKNLFPENTERPFKFANKKVSCFGLKEDIVTIGNMWEYELCL